MTDSAPVANPPVETTPAALRRAAELWPDRDAIADVQPGHDTRWTWAQLLEQVRTFAAGLLARGVEAGDRVVISGFEHNAVLRPLYALGADIVIAGRKQIGRAHV